MKKIDREEIAELANEGLVPMHMINGNIEDGIKFLNQHKEIVFKECTQKELIAVWNNLVGLAPSEYAKCNQQYEKLKEYLLTQSQK